MNLLRESLHAAKKTLSKEHCRWNSHKCRVHCHKGSKYSSGFGRVSARLIEVDTLELRTQSFIMNLAYAIYSLDVPYLQEASSMTLFLTRDFIVKSPGMHELLA